MTVRQDSADPAPTAGTAVGAGLRVAWGRLRDGAAAVRWYVHQVMGDDAYRTYVAHERAVHPDHEPMTEREFWRARTAEMDANPGSRCC